MYLVAVDTDNGCLAAVPANRKGSQNKHVVQALTAFLNNTGLADKTLQSDGEPEIVQLARRVRALAVQQVGIRCSPRGSPQSNGSAENAGARIDAQVRAMFGTVESKSGAGLGARLEAVTGECDRRGGGGPHNQGRTWDTEAPPPRERAISPTASTCNDEWKRSETPSPTSTTTEQERAQV